MPTIASAQKLSAILASATWGWMRLGQLAANFKTINIPYRSFTRGNHFNERGNCSLPACYIKKKRSTGMRTKILKSFKKFNDSQKDNPCAVRCREKSECGLSCWLVLPAARKRRERMCALSCWLDLSCCWPVGKREERVYKKRKERARMVSAVFYVAGEVCPGRMASVILLGWNI